MNHRHPLRHLALLIMLALPVIVAALPAAAQPAGPGHRVYLPAVFKEPEHSAFGLEVFRLAPARGLDLIVATGTEWVRRNGLRWKDVEPEEGKGYRWDAEPVRMLENELISASRNNLKLILVVRGSPRWAVQPHTADCAPVSPDKYAAFARFMAAAVERYSKPPYNVKYWELGNEPDAFIFPTDSVYGCWGVRGDPYYGGEAYGNMLRAVVPAMRRANPHISVLNGGLLLDRAYNPDDPTSLVGRFFEGILRAGAAPYFDIVSFHAYDYYAPGTPEPYGRRQEWKIVYLREIMSRYNVPQKPMIRSESAMLCPVLTPECRWAQADFMARLYTRALRDGLIGNIWFIYDNDSYHSAALVEPGNLFLPRPAYFAYRHAAITLRGARYLGPLEGQPADVEGYRFAVRDKTVFVFWADRPSSVILPIPPGAPVVCTDRDGVPFGCAPSAGRLVIPAGVSPVFVTIP